MLLRRGVLRLVRLSPGTAQRGSEHVRRQYSNASGDGPPGPPPVGPCVPAFKTLVLWTLAGSESLEATPAVSSSNRLFSNGLYATMLFVTQASSVDRRTTGSRHVLLG